MPWRVLAFALGVWLLQQCAVLPAPSLLAALGLGGAALLVSRRPGLTVFGAVLLGITWAGAFAHWRMNDELPTQWEGRDIEITGIVAGLPQGFERGVRFVFAAQAANAPVPSKLLLSWYGHLDERQEEEDEEAGGALSLPHAGERWRLVVRLKRPHGNLNPHGLDYEGWLFERGIRATGYVRKSDTNQRLAPAGWTIERLREAVRARIQRALPEAPYAGVLTALAIGDQQSIAPQLWRLFAATGITHLMSISGLHVTMVGGLVAWLVSMLWRRQPRLPLVWPAQKAAALAAFLGALAYALLAGFAVPAQRTLYMLGVVVAALLSGRNLAAQTVLGAALLLVLLLDPWAVLSAGFWLSFGAVALLFFISAGRLGQRHWLIEWLRAQWAITLGLIPLLLALFQQFSLVSPFANALAIPLVSLAVTPLALLGSLPGFDWALQLAHLLLVPLMDFLQWLAGLPGALWQQHAPPAWAVPVAVVGAVWLLLPRGFPARWAGAVLFLPLFALRPERPAPGEFMLRVLDVGQGQAVHVQTATHDLLFDVGPAFNAQSDAGSRIVVPYLRAIGVARLDRLIVSHADRDHAGGADSLLAALPVATVERRCVDGQGWEWDGIRFRVLHPQAADYDGPRPSNALSCALKIESPHGSALIPGDLEGRAEAEFLARHRDAAHADILVAPHHGGKKTSSPAFVAAVAARDVIFPVGYRNRFGHPYPSVLARYADANIHRTDRDGAVTFQIGAGGTAYANEREASRRYWHNTAFTARE
ncbi:DNA internalization-related competence protein ComEC/Rec2 [Sulfuricystis multivorans]|uniref:DNA internalization-related competence protein ComEC/Rec2 n=1 Tax=Sulfuricystis multivorans TaxID=2211108 RepID=UPI000F843A40|nr:DNA internalization-related competence protein ComEC/Rec2 [Sulfuricystis multivorans]